MFAGDAPAIRPAFERPVMKNGEAAVGGRMNVEFQNIRAGLEACAHGVDRVFEIGMRRAAMRVAVQVSFLRFSRWNC